MAQVEEEIIAAGAEIIWVLEQNRLGVEGNAEDCRSFMDDRGSSEGWCVGDGQTEPTPGTFDESPFSVLRGFDLVVPEDVPTSRVPTAEELELLRQLDPKGYAAREVKS